jgi:CRP/FNR family transcriptional regulator, cyclic AMP receptor protein
MVEALLKPFFADVPADAVAAAARRFYLVEAGRGVTVIEEGEQDSAVLFLLEGHVAIRTGNFEIASVGPGGIVGEVGLFGGALRIASVHAIRPAVYAVLESADYHALLDGASPVAYAIEKIALKQLASRLRDADQRLASLSNNKELPVTPDEHQGTSAVGYVDALAILEKSKLFEGAPIGALDDVSRRMEPRRFNPGEVLCRQGSRGDDLYILADGEVEVTISTDEGHGEVVATLGAGDVFGMASLLQDRPRIASCIARAPVLALRMERAQCLDLVLADIRAGSVLRTAMIRALADQLAYANAQFAQLSLERKRKTAELLARLGIEAHGRHVTGAGR